VSIDYLAQLGIIYHHCPSVSDVDEIASNRSYKNRDEIIISPDKMGDAYDGSCLFDAAFASDRKVGFDC